MNVLVIGSGGREHALSWKLAQSEKVNQVYIAPGNAGTSSVGINLNVGVNDFDAIKQEVLNHQIEMVVVGPEDPLVKGIRDYFESDSELKNIPVIGPNALGAKLEGSKEFSKEFMMRHNIPTARYASFTSENIDEGYEFLESLNPPYVLKADGLAAGKGVLILEHLGIAKLELEAMLAKNKFGEASKKVVIEEFLAGIELSVFVLTDGKSYKILPEAKDYKRIGEGDIGLNTGGMGAISPVPFAQGEFLSKVEEKVIKPTIDGLNKEGFDYKGFIFIGLMNQDGEPFVVEYNVRMGDPETEAVIPRINSDLMDLFEGVAQGNLADKEFEISPKTATTVVMVSGGYPEAYEKGKTVTGLNETDTLVFHAGTTTNNNDQVITNGGRVFAVTGLASSQSEALDVAYKNVEKIKFDKVNYRTDIGFDLK
ncbi:phosphoribosylamine--glycine ligase [bacterium SCSIO 12643]|nr:phosphoribosylamine--glycine ligase [bacterium SCSIO 12643]